MTTSDKAEVISCMNEIKAIQKKLAEVYMNLNDGDEIHWFCKAHNNIYRATLMFQNLVNGETEHLQDED